MTEEPGRFVASGDPTAFFDHSPIIGKANPLAPPLDLRVEGGKVIGTAVFGRAYCAPKQKACSSPWTSPRSRR